MKDGPDDNGGDAKSIGDLVLVARANEVFRFVVSVRGARSKQGYQAKQRAEAEAEACCDHRTPAPLRRSLYHGE